MQILYISMMVTGVLLGTVLLLAALVVSAILIGLTRRLEGWQDLMRKVASVEAMITGVRTELTSTAEILETYMKREAVRAGRAAVRAASPGKAETVPAVAPDADNELDPREQIVQRFVRGGT